VEQGLKLEKTEAILANCIEQIQSGQSTLAECLERYPSRRQELEPLLKMALNIQKPPVLKLDPAYKLSARDQLLRQIRTTKPGKTRSFTDNFSFGLPKELVWARVAVGIVIILVLISMLGGSTAYASQDSLPGDWLYPVKIETEDFRLWMADNNAEKAELNLEFASTRLGEMSQLANRGSVKIDLAVNGYRNNLQAAVSDIQRVTNASILTEVLEKFSLKLEYQISLCDQVRDTQPANIKLIQEASSLAVNQEIDTLKRLVQQDNLKAVQFNLNIMQNRLQRAQVKANEQQYQTMQEALVQYQQFDQLGKHFLETVQAAGKQTTEIDNLSAIAIQGYLKTLDAMAQQVPLEYRNIIETSQELTVQFQNQAHHRYQYQGESAPGPGTPSGDGNGSTIEQGIPPATSQPQGDNGSTGNNFPDNAPTSGNDAGGTTGSGGGSGPGPGGDTDTGSGSGNGPSAAPSPTPTSNTGGNSGSGTGTGSTDGGKAGGSSNSTSGNSNGSAGGLRP
jgi:Domain of unknown function (DUF5667)